eukprot:gnl/MRDRNA2_/MRDRNA2_29253_c0_seq1.p1 gnl/MRDRNA2_/MRDRNA2_29253_c0~~gnl/MRDRNA2_/MRDRNA2_29253_c0_seq1.p1  ORF type:complete len:113 (-),score=16.87 gnl/MRDRNA2_/MRDRNA2_29253_c0_seq1:75-413(-)
MLRFVATTALFSLVAARLNRLHQPLTDAELRATGDTGYPCVASGPMIEICNWYSGFTSENPAPPKSLKEPFIFGGEHAWHGPDEEITKACEANYHTICVQKNPLCDEYFDMC